MPQLLVAHHLVQAIPVFAPVLVLVAALAGIGAADRLRGGSGEDS